MKGDDSMKYICEICGWVYDEEKGHLALDIDPGTKFDELPEGFECPLCYAGKEAFSEVEE